MTLAELLVVMVLLGVVMAAAYAGLNVLQKGAAMTERDAEITRQITYPLTALEKILIQNRSIESGDPYEIIVLTDQNLDGAYERHTISAYNDGRLCMQTESLNASGTAVTTTFDEDLSSKNANCATGVPLFTYLNRQSQEITSSSNVPSQAESLVLTLVSSYQGRSLVESKTINFRNRD